MKNTFNVFIKTLFLFLFVFTSSHAQDSPAKGYIQYLSIDYSEPNIVYAAVIGQGLFKTTDYGNSWKLICDKAYKNEFQIVKIDPKNPDILFAGGERSGLLLSTDKGATWKQIGLDNSSVCDIAIHESNTKKVYVLADEGIYCNNNIDTDKWELIFDRVEYVKKLNNSTRRMRFWDYSRFQKIAVSPHNPNIIIIAARWEGGYHRSDDGGKTWKHESLSGIYRRGDVIHFHPIDSNKIYIGTHHQGLFASYNRGKSWIPHSDGLKPQIRLPYYGAYLISGFAADPTNPETFYSGSDYSNFKTTDGGLNWTELDKSLTCEFVRAMAVDPKNPNIVYAGSNNGIYKSTNAGKSWQAKNNGLRKVDIKKTITVQTSDGKLEYALSEEYPFVYRRDADEGWKCFSWLLAEYGAKKGEDIIYDSTKNELILLTDQGMYKSSDFGYRWIGKGSEMKFLNAKSKVTIAKVNPPQLKEKYYSINVKLKGDVFFDHMLVDSFYRKPPYISLQIVEEGYPFNNSVPAYQTNISDNLISTIYVPTSAIDKSKKYILYAEVRDFQKNYKTGYKKIKFASKQNIEIKLDEGFCLKKRF